MPPVSPEEKIKVYKSATGNTGETILRI